jgi:single-stranded-DNA-specific exonuclease
MAAGMSFHKDNLSAFRRGLGKAIEKQLGGIVREEPTLQIDAWLGLEELNLALAESLELLAPFGAGNPKLTLASRQVTLKAVSEIGKTREHLRLNIEDGDGNTQSILWWGGAGGDLPETGVPFDIAYSLRASSFRGQKQVTLQFEDFRIVEEKAVEIRPSKIEVRDMRLKTFNVERSTLTWAEGSDKSKGKSRFELHPADEFVIYTTPPSPAELRRALALVKPKTVYVFAVPPAEEKPDDFLKRLTGLCKFALNQRGGQATLSALAVAMAARESAVEIGLQWLAAGGHLSVSVDGDAVTLFAQKPEGNPYLQQELFIALRGVLNETAAYRKYVSSANLETLL